jgi:hypothetical protein
MGGMDQFVMLSVNDQPELAWTGHGQCFMFELYANN